MKTLTVLYDDRCPLCRRVKAMMQREPTYVTLHFKSRLDGLLPESARRLVYDHDEELIAYGDDGSVYIGTGAYLMVLWATRRYRPWAVRLGKPALRPLVRKAFDWLTRNRGKIAHLPFVCNDELDTAVDHAKKTDREPCGDYVCMPQPVKRA